MPSCMILCTSWLETAIRGFYRTPSWGRVRSSRGNEMWLCASEEGEEKLLIGKTNFPFSFLPSLMRSLFWVGWQMAEVFLREQRSTFYTGYLIFLKMIMVIWMHLLNHEVPNRGPQTSATQYFPHYNFSWGSNTVFSYSKISSK